MGLLMVASAAHAASPNPPTRLPPITPAAISYSPGVSAVYDVSSEASAVLTVVSTGSHPGTQVRRTGLKAVGKLTITASAIKATHTELLAQLAPGLRLYAQDENGTWVETSVDIKGLSFQEPFVIEQVPTGEVRAVRFSSPTVTAEQAEVRNVLKGVASLLDVRLPSDGAELKATAQDTSGTYEAIYRRKTDKVSSRKLAYTSYGPGWGIQALGGWQPLAGSQAMVRDGDASFTLGAGNRIAKMSQTGTFRQAVAATAPNDFRLEVQGVESASLSLVAESKRALPPPDLTPYTESQALPAQSPSDARLAASQAQLAAAATALDALQAAPDDWGRVRAAADALRALPRWEGVQPVLEKMVSAPRNTGALAEAAALSGHAESVGWVTRAVAAQKVPSARVLEAAALVAQPSEELLRQLEISVQSGRAEAKALVPPVWAALARRWSAAHPAAKLQAAAGSWKEKALAAQAAASARIEARFCSDFKQQYGLNGAGGEDNPFFKCDTFKLAAGGDALGGKAWVGGALFDRETAGHHLAGLVTQGGLELIALSHHLDLVSFELGYIYSHTDPAQRRFLGDISLLSLVSIEPEWLRNPSDGIFKSSFEKTAPGIHFAVPVGWFLFQFDVNPKFTHTLSKTQFGIGASQPSLSFAVGPYFSIGVEASASVSLLCLKVGLSVEAEFLKVSYPVGLDLDFRSRGDSGFNICLNANQVVQPWSVALKLKIKYCIGGATKTLWQDSATGVNDRLFTLCRYKTDVLVSGISWSPPDTPAATGRPLELQATVTNAGAHATPINTDVVCKMDFESQSTSFTVKGADGKPKRLNPGESFTGKVKWAKPVAGTYQVTARADPSDDFREVNEDNNRLSRQLTVVTTPDLTPPEVTSLSVTRRQVGGAEPYTEDFFQATATDNFGVTKMELFVGGASRGVRLSGNATWSVREVLVGAGVLPVRVVAVDAANLPGERTITHDFGGGGPPADVTPPSVSASVKGTRGTITLQAQATDNVGVDRVEFLVDGTVRETDRTAAYAVQFQSTAVSNGNHTLVARAWDAAGNHADSAAVSFPVQNVPPADTTPPTVTGTSVQGTSGTLSLQAQASDNVGVARVEFLVDGTVRGTAAFSPYAVPFQSATVSNGTHRLVARAWDAADNHTDGATVTFTVQNPTADTTPPVVSNLRVEAKQVFDPDLQRTVTHHTIKADAVDNDRVLHVTFEAAGQSFTDAVAPYAWLARDQLWLTGTQTVEARAEDASHNVGGQQITYNFGGSVPPGDAQAPAVQASVSGGPAFTFTATATDNVGVIRVEFLVDGTLVGTRTQPPWQLPYDGTTLATGAHVLLTRASDAAGNRGEARADFTISSAGGDTQAPTVSGLQLATVQLPSEPGVHRYRFTFTAEAADNVGVKRVGFYVNDQLLGEVTAPPYRLVTDSEADNAPLPGSAQMKVIATDAAGNAGVASRAVTIPR